MSVMSISRKALLASKGNGQTNINELNIQLDGIVELLLKVYKTQGGSDYAQN